MGREDEGHVADRRAHRGNLIAAGTIWLVLTVVLEFVVAQWSILPIRMSEEAVIVDDAFQLLMYLAVPVFTFVVVGLGYSAVAFRATDHSVDGSGTAASPRVLGVWLIVTSLLAAFVFVDPGLVGLRDLRQNEGADLVVHAEARRFRWTFTYPDGQEADDALVLPVDTRIRFEVTSRDVLHSFWIPAFRIKIDAVPGRVTETYATPTEEGFIADYPNLRVQCAELCGVGHAQMMTPIRVVSAAEFQEYLAALAQGDEGGGPPPPPEGEGGDQPPPPEGEG